MSTEVALDKVYDPRAVEPRVYAMWEKSGAFRSKPAEPPTPHEKTFTIVIPPPNVTGALHLGHALNNTLQDILVRYHRMRGFNTLWQPGTDHAGIATQAVVERRIREQEGKTRHELGREELVRRIWEWKDEYEARIIGQLKLMGCSCDWERNRFTLDEGMSRAVRHMFFKLFKDGLIFRGKRLVNWDTQLQTAVSDDEVYHEAVKGHFYHFRYPFDFSEEPRRSDEPEFVVIATTRPETMLGDTAVAVHPDPAGELDRRANELRAELSSAATKDRIELEKKLQAIGERRETHLPQLVILSRMAHEGRKIRLPLVDRLIPLIVDEWADPMLGSGCVKITPAHDPNDYQVGVRQKLPMINVLTADGKVARIIEADGSVNPHSAKYEDLEFSTAGRTKVVADIEAAGLLDKIEDREIEIGHSDRSKTPIEPYLSDQWFVDTKKAPQSEISNPKSNGLAQAAIDAVEDGRIQVFPSRYAKSYLDWLGEKRDWCISRQLWWGHRIPVWHRKVRLTQRNWADYLAGKLGVDEIIEGNTKDATLSVTSASGEQIDPQRALMPVTGSTEGEYRIDLCFRTDTPDLWGSLKVFEQDGFVRDDDVLDTWFSSALWPFSTMGWPEETPHLKQFYPGSVLCTSRDIITNWVARMVMFGLYAMGKVPFDHVYIHPKILDGRGETMSKSKGNGVDPVDIIHTHGADALRYTMADMTTETQDIRMPVEYVCPHCGKLVDQQAAIKAEEQNRKSRGIKLDRKLQPADCQRVKCTHKECGKEFATQWADANTKKELRTARETSEKFDIGRNFCNKLWNAARFAFMNLEGTKCERIELAKLPPEDRWILARLSQTVRRYHECIRAYQFAASVKELRDYFWDSLCDWYIELTKPRLTGERAGDSARQVLAFCLDQVLRLWHPTMPFITEELWQSLHRIAPRRGLPGVNGIGEVKTDGLLIAAEFPPVDGYPALDDEAILSTFADLQDATRGVRELRNQSGVAPKDKVHVTVVVSARNNEAFTANAHIVQHMAGIGTLSVVTEAKRPKNSGTASIRGLRIYVHAISDDVADRERTAKSLAALEKQIAGKESKLNNAQFVSNAPPELVETERGRLADLRGEFEGLKAHLAELSETA